MSRKRLKRNAEAQSPTPTAATSSPSVPYGYSIDVGGQRIKLSRDEFVTLGAHHGWLQKITVGETHDPAFGEITTELWPDLIVLKKTLPPWKFTAEWTKRWLTWTKGLPVPGSHDAWKAVWHFVGLTPPDEITDHRITSELKPALLAKHRRDTQDKQRRQDELDTANKMAEAATKFADAVVAAKTPDGDQRPPDDGPFGLCGFRWGTLKPRTGLRSTPFRLLKELWNAKDRTATFDDLAEDVWDDTTRDGHSLRNDSRLGSARRAVNDFMEAGAFPFRVRTSPKNEVVALVESAGQLAAPLKSAAGKKARRSPRLARQEPALVVRVPLVIDPKRNAPLRGRWAGDAISGGVNRIAERNL